MGSEMCIRDRLKYGQEENEVYGVLVDAAWLWEEYLAELLRDKYNHYLKDTGKKFYLFKPLPQSSRHQIIPDYLSLDMSKVADAKYIPLDEKSRFQEDSSSATAIYYKTITYMYRFSSQEGYLLYPHRNKETSAVERREIDGFNERYITKLGLRIPSGCSNFNDFVSRMREEEAIFYDQL